jgi:hypothetical protein
MTGSSSPDPAAVAALFHRLEPLDVEARRAILESEYSGAPGLRREVEELLAALPEGQAMFERTPLGLSGMFDSLQGFLLQGRQIGPFLIEEPMPMGGMGMVVRACDTRTGHAVALKILAPELAGEPQWQRRFAREAAALRSLDDPGIVKLLEAGEDQGFSYLTMELIEGENLRQRMTRRPPSIAESIAWAKGVLNALASAHAAGLLHGDLKPENIMLDPQERIHLLDFGLTRPLSPDVPGTQTASVVTGTIQYLSPERISGAAVDGRSDLFSVGVMLQEFLTGKPPYGRPNPLATAAAILHEPPAALPAHIPPALAAVIGSCLRKDAALRPQNAAAFVRALDRAMLPASSKRRPRLIAAGSALALLALLLAIWRLSGGAARPLHVTVPGATDIWLAGQPAGRTITGVFGTDSTPANAPVPVAAIPGHVLTFSASGSVSVDGDCYAKTPDGGCYPDTSHFGAGPANGIGQFQGPTSALIGVFLNTRAPEPAAVPDSIDFRHVQDFSALSPRLGQVFFIGDGLTSTGAGRVQRFTVPAGATHLFLAASDSLGSAANNAGKFTVDVIDLGRAR